MTKNHCIIEKSQDNTKKTKNQHKLLQITVGTVCEHFFKERLVLHSSALNGRKQTLRQVTPEQPLV